MFWGLTVCRLLFASCWDCRCCWVLLTWLVRIFGFSLGLFILYFSLVCLNVGVEFGSLAVWRMFCLGCLWEVFEVCVLGCVLSGILIWFDGWCLGWICGG